MTVDELIKHYPVLFHMAESGSWPSVMRHGLLSTSALLDLCGINGNERERIESERRPDSVSITGREFGPAVIRDNKPMSDAGLLRSLDGYTPREWYRLLNGFVFFWTRQERLA